MFPTDYFTVPNRTYPDKQDGAKKDHACPGNFNTPVQKKDRKERGQAKTPGDVPAENKGTDENL